MSEDSILGQRTGVLVYGDLMIDIVAHMESDIHIGSDTTSEITSSFGGTAGNVAAWICESSGNCVLAGSVGKDHFGNATVQHYQRLGATTLIKQVDDLPTGVVLALVHPSGERSMLPDARANSEMQVSDFKHVAWTKIAWIYITAYSLMNPRLSALTESLMTAARERGVKVLLDPASAAPLRQQRPADVRRWIEKADLLVPNEMEWLALRDMGIDPVAIGIETLVKRGAEGVRWLHEEEQTDFAAFPTEVIDTVGAGDSFAAGVLSALASGQGLPAAIHRGLETAARALRIRGAQPQVEGL